MVASGRQMPEVPPASIAMLHRVMRDSMRHGIDHRPAEFDHPVGGAVHPELADDIQDGILGVDAGGRAAVQVDPDRLRLAKSANPLEDPHLQVGGADTGGKGAEGAVGAGMAVPHDDGEAGADIAFFRERARGRPRCGRHRRNR